MNFEGARCYDDTRFVSTDPMDQAEALRICAKGTSAECPVLATCLAWVRTEPHFEGVAAGRVWTGKKKKAANPRIPAAEKYAHWSEADMRWAHARWTAGDRNAWAVEGHLAYSAWRKQVSRQRVKARAA